MRSGKLLIASNAAGAKAHCIDCRATSLAPPSQWGWYHVTLENSRVRVLRYHDKPGDKTKPHHHAEFVLYALSSFRRRLSFPDGSARERDFKPGDVIWMPEQVHTGENVGTTDTEVIIVENKLAAGTSGRAAAP